MALKLNSISDPNILLGYQIILPYDMNNDQKYCTGRLPIDHQHVYVIIDAGKNNYRKTEYKIVNMNLPEPIWVRLKRGEKPGIEFRLMRHVVTIYVSSY